VAKYLKAFAYENGAFTIMSLSEFNERVKDSINTPLTLDPLTLASIEECTEMVFNDSMYTFPSLIEGEPNAQELSMYTPKPVGTIDGLLFFRRNFSGPKGFKEALDAIFADFTIERQRTHRKLRIFFATGKQPSSYIIIIDDDQHNNQISVDDVSVARLFISYRKLLDEFLAVPTA